MLSQSGSRSGRRADFLTAERRVAPIVARLFRMAIALEGCLMIMAVGSGRAFCFASLTLSSLLMLVEPRCSPAQTWHERRVGPLACRAEFPLDPYFSLLEETAHIEGELQRLLGLDAGREPVVVTLFGDE